MKFGRVLTMAVVISLAAPVAWAGRPLITEDAGTVDKGKWQIEAGVDFLKNGKEFLTATPGKITYGILPDVEFGVGCGMQFTQGGKDIPGAGEVMEHVWTHEEGALDVSFETKWQFWKQEQGWFNQAFKFGVMAPTASYTKGLGSGRMDASFIYVVTRDIQEGLAVDFNVGYLYLGDRGAERFDDAIFYSVAGRWAFLEKWEGVMEIVAQTPTTKFDQTTVGINAGVRYEVAPGLVLDAAVGTRLIGDWPDLTATMGMTWGF